jgi:muconolactone delta-isomerase
MEFLVEMVTTVPEGTSEDAVAEMKRREAARARELAVQGHILRLWKPPEAPGEWRTFGLFSAADGDELHQVLTSMPLHVWRNDTITPFTPHPSDPGTPGAPA